MKYQCQKPDCNDSNDTVMLLQIVTGDAYWCIDCISHELRTKYEKMESCPLCYDTKPYHADDCLMRKLSPPSPAMKCMRCGAVGAKEYHSEEKIKNKEHLVSHIVRCGKCYDFVAHEIWPEECDCFK